LTVQGLILIAFTPGLFWLWFFLRLDRYRPEPKRLIALTFLLGCLSTIPAGIVNASFGIGALLDSDPDLITVAAGMLLVVGPIEELSKFVVVRLVPYRSLYFDEPMDGLVYGATASLGFASLENLFYVLEFGPGVMLVRAPISTLAHLVFGSIWGYALGQHHSSGGNRQWLVAGTLALAATVHALFNVAVFTFPLASLALVAVGGVWAFNSFRRGQQTSPFRFKRNYPQVECRSCGELVGVLNQFCTSCGMPVLSTASELICGRCHNRNRPDADYCTSCGGRLLRR
jgi:RsiW-degrading membrane proteinase PrsW (M82 family)